MDLGNSPVRETHITLVRGMPYALGVWFKDPHGAPIDLTTCVTALSVVKRTPAARLNIAVLQVPGEPVGSIIGFQQYRIQATDMYIDLGEYFFGISVGTSDNYAAPVCTGVLEVVPGLDFPDFPAFTQGILDPDKFIGTRNVLEVKMNLLDDVVTVEE